MTLENALETAFANVLRSYQPELVDVRINLASAGLEQTPVVNDEDEPPTELRPLPCIRLEARRGAENPPASGVHEVELTIDVEAAAVVAEGDGLGLEDLFGYATRPTLYQHIVGILNAAHPALTCYGIPRRLEGISQGANEASYTRTATAMFICSLSQN